MIIGHIDRFSIYLSLNPLFPEAFEYLRTINKTGFLVSKQVIVGEDLFALFTNFDGVSSSGPMECHNKYIDIHYCFKGADLISWKAITQSNIANGVYDVENDVTLFEDSPTFKFELKENHFVIFFPDDVHRPLLGSENLMKVVLKVKVF